MPKDPIEVGHKYLYQRFKKFKQWWVRIVSMTRWEREDGSRFWAVSEDEDGDPLIFIPVEPRKRAW